jgi:hypothetical protein
MRICLYVQKGVEPLKLIRSFGTMRNTMDYVLTVMDELREQGYSELVFTRRQNKMETLYKSLVI